MDVSLTLLLRKKGKKKIVFYGRPEHECGVPVYRGEEEEGLSFADWAEDKSPDAVILIKQMIAHRQHFERLMDYCRQSNAVLYDERGRDIGLICRRAAEAAPVRASVLTEEIKKHDYISFDIFDTLLVRKVLLPEDVFDLVAQRLDQTGVHIKEFRKKRMKAQEILGLTNPDIYEIYRKLQKIYKLSWAVAEICLQTEIEVETEVLTVREEMLKIYRHCLQMGKKVYLVTDMYIPAHLLEPILEKKGIAGYQGLYVSCDKKRLKLQGLLESYRGEIRGEKCLHIGDHRIHDGICAELAGVDYCLIESSYRIAEKSLFKEAIDTAVSLEERIMLGMIIAKAFNNPFAKGENEEGIQIHSDYEYSYFFCAAFISQYALWIYDNAANGNFENVLFAARDGFLMRKMYRMIRDKKGDCDTPKDIYFYTSRKASVMTCINNEAYINMIIDISGGMSPKKLMRERFGLPENQIQKYDAEEYKDGIHRYVWKHADAIFARAEKARRNYFRYMGNIDLKIGKRYAFVDFVSAGTSQKSLAKIAPFEMVGLYAGWNGTEPKENIPVMALFEDKNSFFLKRYKILETFLTSEEPSLSHFNDQGEPVFSAMERTEHELKYVKNMQEACIDFLGQLLELLPDGKSKIGIEFTDRVFAASKSAVILDEKSELNHLSLMDDWQKRRDRIERIIQ